MKEFESKLDFALKSIKQFIDFQPKIGIVCGSGLGNLAEKIDSIFSLPYDHIKGMPVSTVEGHSGQFVFGYIHKIPVVLMQGRIHYYEGYRMDEVVMPIRLMGMMGVEYLFLTNAAGGITFTNEGDLMLITDQICLVPSPLIGPNIDKFGPRFPDMTNAYDKDLIELARAVARDCKIDLKEGVYIQMQGPNFETPAEVRMAKILGADAVGMSTAVETIAAVQMGLKVVGLSCIANPACGIIPGKTLDHVDVQDSAQKAEANMIKLGDCFIKALKRKNKW